jgi:hypothetical protein
MHIRYQGFIKGSDPINLTGIGLVMRFFRPFTHVPQHREELLPETILNNTDQITYVHSFQNYAADKGMNIDFSVLL